MEDSPNPVTGGNVIELFNNSKNFANEKSFCDYIELNIPDFTKELGYNYISHKREYPITAYAKFGARPARIDFSIEVEPNVYIFVECKTPKQVYTELNKGISQILSYHIKAEECKIKVKDFWLVTTMLDLDTIKIIQKFKLPINICVLDKANLAIWRHDG